MSAAGSRTAGSAQVAPLCFTRFTRLLTWYRLINSANPALVLFAQTSVFASSTMGRSEEARCRVDVEQINIEIEWLECLFRLPDNTSPEMSYSTAANQGITSGTPTFQDSAYRGWNGWNSSSVFRTIGRSRWPIVEPLIGSMMRRVLMIRGSG